MKKMHGVADIFGPVRIPRTSQCISTHKPPQSFTESGGDFAIFPTYFSSETLDWFSHKVLLTLAAIRARPEFLYLDTLQVVSIPHIALHWKWKLKFCKSFKMPIDKLHNSAKSINIHWLDLVINKGATFQAARHLSETKKPVSSLSLIPLSPFKYHF